MKYIFFIGRNYQLALAELKTFFNVPINVVANDVVLLELDQDPAEKQKTLGSVIKIARVLNELELQDVDKEIVKLLKEKSQQKSGKTTFALNHYTDKRDPQFLKKHLITIKKAADFSLRFCNNNFKNVTSVITCKQILKKNNSELNLVKNDNNKYLLAETISCQNPDEYSKRDYDKPWRDAKVGMMPPKLAQIMINLAGETKTIWDPFCGTGTILQEAMLMNKKVIGSDYSDKMIAASKKNLHWLFNDISQVNLFQHDATKPAKIKADAIITEGYLGEPKKRTPTHVELIKTDEELSNIYKKFLKNAADNNVKTIVCCLPVYKMAEGLGYLKKTYKMIIESNYLVIPIDCDNKKSILYYREKQFVYREIFLLNLKK